MSQSIRVAKSDEDILRCFPVMLQLRPQLRRDEFVARIRLQEKEGFRLALLEADGDVVATTGFRILTNLGWGHHLYVDDLVTDDARRSQGHGKALFDWLVATARAAGCQELHLDSGVQRFGAHRFYLESRMEIRSHHFQMRLEEPAGGG